MTPRELQDRTLAFALQVYRLVKPLLKEPDTRHVALQLLRCATSVAANYRSACLARSPKEFTAKAGLLREESDETLFWLIFIDRSGMATSASAAVNSLTNEADQLARIFRAAYRTSRLSLASRKLGKAKQADSGAQ